MELKLEDFLCSRLPNYPYKVFSNIPFNITSAIVKKLTLEGNPPEIAYLILQKEAAMKFAGKPLASKNSQLAAILNPWFEFCVTYNFKPSDFYPVPNVDIILLEIRKRTKPLIDYKERTKWEDFVAFAFNQFKPNVAEGLTDVLGKQNIAKAVKPSELDFKSWISLFTLFLKVNPEQQNIVRGSFTRQLKQQEKIEKINRTRIDKNWRNFKGT